MLPRLSVLHPNRATLLCSPGSKLGVQYVHSIWVLLPHAVSVQVSQGTGRMRDIDDVARLHCLSHEGHPACGKDRPAAGRPQRATQGIGFRPRVTEGRNWGPLALTQSHLSKTHWASRHCATMSQATMSLSGHTIVQYNFLYSWKGGLNSHTGCA